MISAWKLGGTNIRYFISKKCLVSKEKFIARISSKASKPPQFNNSRVTSKLYSRQKMVKKKPRHEQQTLQSWI